MIELWKDREILYNPRHPKYHIREENANAIKEICEEFQDRGITLTADQINKKLTTLKNYCCKERGKLTSSKKSGAGANQVYTVKRKYFSHLEFLNDHITPRGTISTFSASGFPSDDNDSELAPPPKKNQKQNQSMEKVEFMMESAVSYLKNGQNSHSQKSDDDHCGETLARLLKKVPEGQGKEMLKINLQHMIIQATPQTNIESHVPNLVRSLNSTYSSPPNNFSFRT